eukprot:TRINITY_DN2912_c0_g1_i1.p1 TRINITY_DN2912_c0_g1~~TRINITY_DN2912_c0_g1_i1.p1  ORF type:complete len:536 (-),score=144.87 TRINITY_DN2912_c0_g1_i1:87-1694(-)
MKRGSLKPPSGTLDEVLSKLTEALNIVSNETKDWEEDDDEVVLSEKYTLLENRMAETERKYASMASLLDNVITRLQDLEGGKEKGTESNSTRVASDNILVAELRDQIGQRDQTIKELQVKLQEQEKKHKQTTRQFEDMIRRVIGEVHATEDARKELEKLAQRTPEPTKTTPIVAQPVTPPTVVTNTVPEISPASDSQINYPRNYNPYARRFSVSDESRNPDQETHMKSLKSVPKSRETKESIRKAIMQNLLFKKLDEEQIEKCLDVMFEKRLKPGEVIIRQGASGDNFYIVDQGNFDVIKDGLKVNSLGPGRSFGELALMYGAPRNATITATTHSICWAMDRTAFRSILMNYTIRKRTEHENFLQNVPILSSLNPYERAIIADALEAFHFDHGDVIIRQGEDGDIFYIIEHGEAIVTQSRQDNTRPIEVTRYQRGSYFGEVALLTNKPRAANVIANGQVKCLGLNRKDFTQLMGPCDKILQRNMEQYKTYEEIIKSQPKPQFQSRLSVDSGDSPKKKRRNKKKNKKPETPDQNVQ